MTSSGEGKDRDGPARRAGGDMLGGRRGQKGIQASIGIVGKRVGDGMDGLLLVVF